MNFVPTQNNIPYYKRIRLSKFLFFLLTISIGFGNINIDLGFSLKPYMIISIISFLSTLYIFQMDKLFSFEKTLLTYSLFYVFTIAQFNYIREGLWYSCVFIILIFFYIVFRRIIKYVNIDFIEKTISISGLIICTASILYYCLGIYKLGADLSKTGIVMYGVMIDRFVFRLCGTINEPNLVSVYLAPFFFYYLFNFRNIICKIGLCLTFIIIILTMSRGAIMCLFASLILGVPLIKNKTGRFQIYKFFKWLIIVGGSIVIILLMNEIDVLSPITNRFENIGSDSGSGRLDIWSKAIITFLDNPFWGVGLNGIRSYNLEHYGAKFNVFTHNSYLEVLVESGIFGFILFIVFWIQLMWTSINLTKKQPKCNYLLFAIIYITMQITFLSAQLNEMIFFMSLLIYKYYSCKYKISNESINSGTHILYEPKRS